ncbi:MAG: hypothetical protein Q4D96_09765, partial [Propionibacteriaceae bacterium]|nr:hypothetical protein [Propionibacteriaceae bacterium]
MGKLVLAKRVEAATLHFPAAVEHEPPGEDDSPSHDDAPASFTSDSCTDPTRKTPRARTAENRRSTVAMRRANDFHQRFVHGPDPQDTPGTN